MDIYSKRYQLAVKNNPCFLNHKINENFVLPMDGLFELILIYLIKQHNCPFPISFADIQIKQMLTAENIQSEKSIQLNHNPATNEINIEDIATNNSSILSGFLSANQGYHDLSPAKHLAQKITLQDIYIQEHSEILPFYHSVKEIAYDENYASATLHSSLGKNEQALFYNDVTILNGVFIALINFHMLVNHSTQLNLPFYIRRLSFFKKIEQGNYILEIERGEQNSYSLRLRNEHNEVVFAADGIELKPLGKEATTKGLNTKSIPEPIAIIGLSGRFPQSKNLDEFWKNLCQGYDGISQIAKHRRQDYNKNANSNLEYGGFLDDIATFDARFFDISGHEALAMEPQQRLFLESAWEALEQAGYSNRKQLNCGVYLGITQGDYLSLKEDSLASIPQSFWGSAPSVAASRISYFLDLKGPAIAFDTACSSSLTALHMACEQLRNSDLELAIAGGVFITVTDQFHQKAFRANMLSADNQCHAFSAKANGFVPGEAVAAVVLKRLSQAQKEGDFIHAVIVGSGINQDGRTNGITAPNSKSQTALQKSVYEKFHLDPKQIGYIEAHGTGTILGDPIELKGLEECFSAFTQQKQFCAIGSVKSNIGHSAAAAGMASLIKVCLSLKYQTIPLSRHTEVINPEIDFKNSAFLPPQETSYWPSQNLRMAAINSFGFSGTNVHVVIKEYINNKSSGQDKKDYLFPFTAKNDEDLLGYIKDFSFWLLEHNEYNLSFISYTLSCRKKHFDSRFIIAATHKQELISTLNSLVEKGVGELKNLGFINCPSLVKSEQQYLSLFNDFLAKKEIAWLDYFKEDDRCVVPLPTYHWQKTEYWPHALESRPKEQASTDFKLSQNDKYIKDHIIQGVNILPAAAYLAFCYSRLKGNITLANIYFLYPFRVENEEKLFLDLNEDDQTFSFKKENKTYCHGEFRILNEPNQDVFFSQKKHSYLLKKNEIYRRLLSQDLFYGDSLKKLESIAFDETELVAHAHFRATDDLIAILDASLQTTVVFNSLNKQYLPFHINSLTIHQIPQGDVYIHAKKRAADDLSLSCNLVILDSNHQLCIDIQGFESRAPLNSGLSLPKLYFRAMEELIIDKSFNNVNKLENTIVLTDTFLKLDNLPETNLINLNLDLYSYDFIEYYEAQKLDNLTIYFLTTRIFVPDDLTLIQWIFNFLQRLLKSTISKIRLIFIFNEKNSIQVAALEGLMLSLSLETEKISFQLIQTDKIVPTFKRVLEHQSSFNHYDFIEIDKSDSRPIYSELDISKNAPILKKNGVYLISGGTGGLGSQLIQYLTSHYQATLIVISRSMDPKLASNVYQYQCDLSDRTELNHILTDLRRNFPVINGVFHLAGLLDDKLFINMTWDSFYRVIAPKQLGLVYLNELTKHYPFDFFCCFSSLSAFVGNPGQSAYAYANRFLDHYMRYRKQLSDDNQYFGFSQSISWPLWKGAGMGSKQEIQALALKRWKLSALDSQLAFSFLEQALASQQTNVLVANDYLVAKPTRQTPVSTRSFSGVNLLQLFSETLKIPSTEIHLEKPFLEYGIDSLLAVGIVEKLSAYYGELPKSLLLELSNLAELSDYLSAKNPDLAKLSKNPKKDTLATNTNEYPEGFIAIIGLAGKYPEADNLNEFWDILRQNKSAIRPLAKRQEHLWPYAWAGLINHYDYFDPLFFGVSPLDAIIMDPQERQFLQIAYHAFENAGYPKQRLKNDQQVGVFVGVMYGLYQLNAIQQPSQSNKTAIANSTFSSIANRVSYCLDLQGPSIAVDSMCSSSLTAIHLGIQSLLLRETNMVLCGGVNVITHPYKYAELQQKSFLATDGLCHSFSAGGDGYVPGEGVGAIVLKRLEDALRDNDRIEGVIRASALNHGGFSSGYTVPKKAAQQKLLKTVLEKSRLKAEDIQYIEAHGTGTELGDPIEFRALSDIYNAGSLATIYLGSLKSNVGHLESAAGIAALTKVLLQMRHQEISPHLLHGPINPNLALSNSCFEFAKTSIPWRETYKYAAISSFGAGGSNAHLIISNYIAKPKNKKIETRTHLFCVSANTTHGLKLKWQQLKIWLLNHSSISLNDLSYTLAVGRDHFQQKSILVCNSYEEVLADIEHLIEGRISRNYVDHNWQKLSNFDSEIQRKISAYFDQKILNFDLWFLDEKPEILDLPLYPYEELRYNLLNSTQRTKLRKQGWSHLGACLNEETKLIEACLVIINGVCPIITTNINQTSCFILDLAKPNYKLDLEKGIQWLASSQNPKIVDLVGIRSFDKTVFAQLFDLYQAFLKLFKEVSFKVYSFYSPSPEDEFLEFMACLDALLYVIKAEHHLLNYYSIEIDGFTSLKSAFNFEQDNITQATKIKYREGVRYLQEYDLPMPDGFHQKKIDPNRYYLITGGSSGIGYLTAQHLVNLGAKKLILMGITPLPEESQWSISTSLSKKQQLLIQNLSALINQGIELKHSSCSLNNLQVLAQFLQPYKNKIAGIIHAAGITGLKLESIGSKTQAEFDEHLKVKYFGLKHILNLIAIDKLDFIFAFSSLSSSHSNEARGISSYAFANHVIDNYMEYLSSKYPGKCLAIRWPLWRESSAGQMSRSVGLETTEAFAIFDEFLMSYRDGVINVEFEQVTGPNESIEKAALTPVSTPKDTPILQWLTNYFITQMKIPSERIDLDKSFIEYGIDSILLLNLINALESHIGQAVTPTIVLENPTLRMLSTYFNHVSLEKPNNSFNSFVMSQVKYDEDLIAIIGVAGRFPSAKNLSQFWDNLIEGRCEIKSVPQDRLGDIHYSEKAGFLNEVKWFDPNYFGFHDDYARQLDPLIRLSLELSLEAMLNAGYTPDEFKGKNCAVLVAARAANYVDYLNSFGKETISGIGQNFLAAQVSQYFNLSGPSYVVDSACSSSLAAIYLACQHLKSKDADYALVTGVELLLDNRPFELLRAGGALSVSQSCQPFAENADGIVLGEGGGTLILKRLKDAISDGDKIEAIIKGGAINNDGQTMGVTTPNPQSQSAVVQKALDNAGLQAESISYIEAHATGTALGDPMELAALTKVFSTNKRTFCAVGSVKSNIGHLLSAAGMASILKVVLALKHHQLPRSLGCENPNKRFKFEESPFYLVKDNLAWSSEQTRYAGVSGFGFGGTNVHLILSEFSLTNTIYTYQQNRFELKDPEYNKKYLWPSSQNYQQEEMASFFEINELL